ncbi:MAG TPA: immunoglobulin domain-containing protein, partial [Candidatus Acidoferrum sp.]|nr:immunoglobulin domain-containing protein [Candidatus Acidoferrum sp.]
MNGTAYLVSGLRVEEILDNRPPTISVQPQSIEQCAGSPVTFSVTAGGTSPLAYQWQKVTASETNNITQTTNSVLNLPAINSGDAASYRVVITNLYGSETSQVATLTLGSTPVSIIAQLQSRTNFAGNTVQFTVALNQDASTPINFQWYRTNSSGTEAIAAGTNAMLAFVATSNEAASYYVRVANCVTAVTSSVASLVVEMKSLTVTNQPVDTAIIVGSNGVLSVGVDGSLPSFQWFKNGVALAIATNATLTFVPATLADSGQYQVVASSSLNSVTSRVALLNVIPPSFSVIRLTNQLWRYNQSGTDLGEAWRDSVYPPATNWPQGRGVLAIEDNASIRPLTNTVLSVSNAEGAVITYYFRTEFVLTNEPGDVQLLTSNLIDDGAIVYVNGFEAYRINMPLSQISYSTLALGTLTEGAFVLESIPGSLLRKGMNLIAIEVHQVNAGSSDVAMGFAADLQFVPPSFLQITNEPFSQSTDELRPAALSVGWSGTGARLQWFKQLPGGPVALSGSTFPTLQFSQPRIGIDDGVYFAVLSNVHDFVISSPATLIITQAPPTIVRQPVGAKLCPGGPVLLESAAIGSAANTFQWRRGGAAIEGATNPTYLVASASVVDSGVYSVLVSNSLGLAVSSNAIVDVNQLPFFLLAPHGTGASGGGNALFSTVPGGCGPFTFQWQFNGADISGATNATLSLTNMQLSHEGMYRVLVWNSNGVSPSAEVPLIMSLGLALNATNIPWNVVTGSVAIVGAANAHDGIAAASFDFNGMLEAVVIGPGKLTFWSSGSLSFTVDGVVEIPDAAQGGWRRYEVWLGHGSHLLQWRFFGATLDEVSFTSNNLAAAINVPPQDLSVSAGSDFLFEPAVDGLPPVTIRWQWNGEDIPSADPIYVIRNAQLVHAGTYTLIVSNAFGQTSASTVVTVNPSPVTFGLPSKVRAVSGADVILKAQVRGSEPITYQWRHEGQSIAGATNETLLLA